MYQNGRLMQLASVSNRAQAICKKVKLQMKTLKLVCQFNKL